MNRVRAFAGGYFVLFLVMVAVGHVPAFQDEDGNLFGLFNVDIYDETVHLASAFWAVIAAVWSVEASRFYFRLIGPLYVLDALLGLLAGSGFLDGGIFLAGPADGPLVARFLANLPHLVIGGVAVWVGYVLAAPPSPDLPRELLSRGWERAKGWWSDRRRPRAGPRHIKRPSRNVVLSLVAFLLLAALIPIFYIEAACRQPLPGYAPILYYSSMVGGSERRPEARTWLAWPQWHINYSADSLGRHLAKAPPSSYPYWQDVRSFWSGYCLVNRATGDMRGAGDAKMSVYAMGLGYSGGMLVKGLYENTVGRLFEWIGGWHSQDDRYAARVQQRYAAFRHDNPWHGFPFGEAFSGLWGTYSSPSSLGEGDHPKGGGGASPPQVRRGGVGAFLRHWERRLALSTAYGLKAAFAKLTGTAAGSSGGGGQLQYFVARASQRQLDAADPRLQVIRGLEEGRVVVRAPRDGAFTAIAGRLASRGIVLDEIAGNNDIFVTFLMPGRLDSAEGVILFARPLPDRPGWVRVGVSTKVPRLTALIRAARAEGGTLERVYDY